MIEIALLASVTVVCVTALGSLQMVLKHREKRFEHAPLAEMERKLSDLESRLLNSAMRR